MNARCGGTQPYVFASTGDTLGSDAIRVALIYRSGVLAAVGSPLVDMDPAHNRPPTAQTFDVVDAANPAFGKRFSVVANHLKSKGCGGATGADRRGDGQGCFTARASHRRNACCTWINSVVMPAAGDPDVLLLGDFNAYAQETPITTLDRRRLRRRRGPLRAARTRIRTCSTASSAISTTHFASASLGSQVAGVAAWHINADEIPTVRLQRRDSRTPARRRWKKSPMAPRSFRRAVVFQAGTP